MLRKLGLLLLFSSIMQPVFAQAPQYTRLLYQNLLTGEGEDEFATAENHKGTFVNGGWQAVRDSKLTIQLNDRLPAVGSIEFSITNYNPVMQATNGKQTLFALTSRPHSKLSLFYEDSLSSFMFLRSGINYVNGDQCGLEFDTAFEGKISRDADRVVLMENRWESNETYHFKFVWDHDFMWFFLDGQEVKKQLMKGPVERIQHLSIGGDDIYSTLSGPIYSDVKIYSADTPVRYEDKTFTKDVTGLNDPKAGRGIAVADINDDGLDDMYVAHFQEGEDLRSILYVQQPDHSFLDETSTRGLPTDSKVFSTLFFDADNDGDSDLFCSRVDAANRLYLNDGAGHFTDASAVRGISNSATRTSVAAAFDADNDGDIDLLAVNQNSSHEMYINNDDTFVATARGFQPGSASGLDMPSATVVDVENDGDADVYISWPNDDNELYVNDGNGNFSEQAASHGVGYASDSHGAIFADFDNDGDSDLFLSTTVNDFNTSASYLKVYANDGNGFYSTYGPASALAMNGYSVQILDADNDGNLDIYCLQNNQFDRYFESRVWHYFRTSMARLYLGDGAGNFAYAGDGVADIVGEDARSVVANDFDNDGDVDIYVTTTEHENIYLENSSELTNNWLDISAIGPNGDLGGMGSRIALYESGHLGDDSYLIANREVVSQSGYLSGNNFRQHFGLGGSSTCDVRVSFVNGRVYEESNVAANQRLVIAAPQHTYTLENISGDGQSGIVNQKLASPFRVRLLDEEGLPVSGATVGFVVTSGSAVFESGQNVTTDASGYASNYLVLGGSAGTVISEARVGGAINSPVQFTTTASESEILLQKISGDAQTGIVGAALSQPIVLRTVFDNGAIAPNVIVTFDASNGGLVNGASAAVLSSDSQGIVSVVWTLGPATGAYTLLATSPSETISFTATALPDAPHSLQKISGDGQALNPGTAFTNHFNVKMIDQYGNEIADKFILFQVTEGAGSINGVGQLNVSTDNSGVAGVVWTPDAYLGPTNSLQASASINGQPLTGSPVVWTYAGIPVDASLSTVTATGPFPADGSSSSDIIVSLKNSQNQSVGAGLSVALSISGSGNQIDMPSEKTDANGQVRASLSSTVGEIKTITARVLGLNLELTQHPTVEFITTHTAAAKIVIQSGDGGSAVVMQALPLVVKVVDDMDRSVPNHNVTFIRLSGDGGFSGSVVATLPTVEDGTATAHYTFGQDAYAESVIEARAESISETVTFTVRSRPGEPKKIVIVSGNYQQGAPRAVAAEPLIVNVKDLYDNNIAAYPVKFNVNTGDCWVNGATQTTVLTDSSGRGFVSATFGSGPGQSIIEARAASISVAFTLSTTENVPTPDLALSRIAASSPVPADGYSTSHVVATIIDSYGRLISGAKVKIVATGDGAKLVQPDSLTDANGKVTAELSSTVVGEKAVMAYILPGNELVEQVASVTFDAIQVDMALFAGQDQQGIVGKACPAPLVVRLQSDNNPVVDQYVKFSVVSGGGHFSGQPELVVKTDAQGLAPAEYFLGTIAGENVVLAEALISPDKNFRFDLQGDADTPTQLAKVSGDEQVGGTLSPLDEYLVVTSQDVYGNPASGDVTFSAVDGGKVIASQPVVSDSLGRAEASVELGDRIGRYTFKAELPNGEFALFTANSVRLNNPPEIISYIPFESTLKFAYNDRLHFEIMNVFDQDGDSLIYEWQLNGRSIGTAQSLDLYMTQAFPTLNALVCSVSDGFDAVTTQWTLTWDPASHVELGAFQAEFQKGKGVLLTWTIKSQQENAGFRMLRSLSKSGPFVALTTDLIVAQTTSQSEYSFIDDSAHQPGLYYYKLESISKSGHAQQFETISVTVQAPEQLALLQNYPNPFNPTTAISFELPEAARINLAIYNQNGQMVRELLNAEKAMGLHSVIWDARDQQGHRIPSGIYFYVLTVDGHSITRKLTLLK
jgi:hypothetical protein